jgi:F-type H+/Na+-transporting ATPase subunit alpha
MNAPATAFPAPVRERLERIHWQVRHREVGEIIRVGDGVAHVRGLSTVRYGELLQCRDGLAALAFDLRSTEISVLFLGPADRVRAGDEVSLTGRVASVPVGSALLGRVVDGLGRPLDGGPPVRADAFWPVEREAPGVIERQPVCEPLVTGVKVIDAMLPIGRGQRELVLGDRSTGKTAIAIDAILAQRTTGVKCIYTAIGQRQSTIAEIVDLLTQHGAMEFTTIVAASADSPPGLQYLAPYAACTIGEFFMRRGGHVLIIYDDLTKHADSYRRISLLLGRPPGREAYPPDVFYLHARLLERATRLHDRLGGGSLTALPLAATQAGNIAAYVPTNLISITDGQIYLDARLFNEGLRPAVDVGLSVSRLGAKAQAPILRRPSSDLRLLYSQLRELENFSRFGADLGPESRQRLERGQRLREAFKQPRLGPWPAPHQAAALFAVREGLLDQVPVADIVEFLERLRKRLDDFEAELVAQMATADRLTPEDEARLRQAIEAARPAQPALRGEAP